MVVMSLALYEKKEALIGLYQKLSEAEAESKTAKFKISHRDLMSKMRTE